MAAADRCAEVNATLTRLEARAPAIRTEIAAKQSELTRARALMDALDKAVVAAHGTALQATIEQAHAYLVTRVSDLRTKELPTPTQEQTYTAQQIFMLRDIAQAQRCPAAVDTAHSWGLTSVRILMSSGVAGSGTINVGRYSFAGTYPHDPIHPSIDVVFPTLPAELSPGKILSLKTNQTATGSGTDRTNGAGWYSINGAWGSAFTDYTPVPAESGGYAGHNYSCMALQVM